MEARIRELEQENANLKKAEAAPVNAPLQLPDPSITPIIPYEETQTVTVRLFRDEYRYKAPLYVSINGKNWLIKRGVEVQLPKYVADFIEQQMREEAAIWERVEKEEREYRDQTAKLG
jgi:hypothetical protein